MGSAGRKRQETLRVPPVVVGVAGSVARLMREHPEQLDDIARARMERSLVQAWRTHASARVPLFVEPSAMRSGVEPTASRAELGRFAWKGVWVGVLAASAVAGSIFGLYAMEHGGRHETEQGIARFQLRIGEAAVQSGSVSEGQLLESGKHGHIELDLGSARVDMARGTRVRFDRIAETELSLSLEAGRVDVDFHPRKRGEQQLSVESRTARVLVVGTRFSVAVDEGGNTTVAVVEGTVEVVPRAGGETRRLTGGQRTQVRVDEGDAYERAVREAIEHNLRRDGSLVPPPQDADYPFEVEAEPAGAVSGPGMVKRTEPVQQALPAGGLVVSRHRVVLPGAIRERLEGARQLLRDGRHAEARARLHELAMDEVETQDRAEALTLIAESYSAQGSIPRATAAYRDVVEAAVGHPAGHNAQFALARLLERHGDDREIALEAYRRYLELAPAGALAAQANEAVCRLSGGAGCQ